MLGYKERREFMNTLIEHLTGLDTLTDQIIAADFLISAKSGMKMYAVAVTEAATPEMKTIFRQHLEEAITTHEQIINYMMKKGYYHPYNMNEQIQMDMRNIHTVLNIPT
jgi:similar to spore coat protein